MNTLPAQRGDFSRHPTKSVDTATTTRGILSAVWAHGVGYAIRTQGCGTRDRGVSHGLHQLAGRHIARHAGPDLGRADRDHTHHLPHPDQAAAAGLCPDRGRARGGWPVTPAIPPEIQAIVDRLVAQGAEVEVIPVPGQSVVFRADAVGAAQETRGDKLRTTVTGEPAVVDALAGSASSGGITRKLAADALHLPSGPTPLLIVPGVLCLGLAAFAGYRARVGLALVVGAVGAGLIAGAFYPPAFGLAALGLIAGAVLYFRGDLRRGLVEQAFARTAAIVETEAPDLKDKIRKTTPPAAKRAAGKVLRREGVS